MPRGTRQTVTDGGLIKRAPLREASLQAFTNTPMLECALKDTAPAQNENLPH
ncbi:hypothetical protein CBM2633_A140168 [Cupriavidus taiwanensis]|uniref:Uncharacterized protein n=1 Tax=Cupriavidus taiwanensis TaxID=164546 RepID=A0A375E4H5_9BURK|nr:hypothetical protein CBM2615_A330089 [Cupriavidus taiwanensis]SOZ58432.1 hypothetical protein CBM2614_A290089 [Cupriavidus taiwanensis]SOZ61992.1 hypothetical protein CBM2613_A300087 [Cupriavidus taiwanensis]SPA06084.1 hypothetical protein CBM2625_A240089 [Cupriavidus taiwanensis]SPA12836.1 hypothetical protein CBM2633_A140168 [Cupriavidus taiwanensis]